MTIEPVYQGEVQLSAWGENTTEMWVRFKLDDGPDGVTQNPFKPYGKERKRFMVAIVPIADDETAERPKKNPESKAYADKSEGEKAVARAGMLCADQDFQDWFFGVLSQPCPPGPEMAERVTASRLRDRLNIESRREIADNHEAFTAFLDLEADFRRDTGRQAEKLW